MINTYEGNMETNIAHVSGTVIEECILSHKTYGEAFYTFKTGISRNSGYEDQVIIMASERITNLEAVKAGSFVEINGQIRTYNEDVEGHNRLNIVVFAKDIEFTEYEKNINEIFLEGYLCKKPIQRTSPLGRKICDIMLAVNRMYNKSDYIPCISWGRNAVYSGTLEIGDKIAVNGRLQSRQYKKRNENGETLLKTAYEVSVLQLETCVSSVL